MWLTMKWWHCFRQSVSLTNLLSYHSRRRTVKLACRWWRSSALWLLDGISQLSYCIGFNWSDANDAHTRFLVRHKKVSIYSQEVLFQVETFVFVKYYLNFKFWSGSKQLWLNQKTRIIIRIIIRVEFLNFFEVQRARKDSFLKFFCFLRLDQQVL